jgi:zinc/manganese transport system substrate-binding protein
MKTRVIVGVLGAALLVATPLRAQGKLNVIATTEDVASIAREVGGDRITVEAMAKGYQDPHFVEAKPSFILKLQKAELLIVVGSELEIGWLPPPSSKAETARSSRVRKDIWTRH